MHLSEVKSKITSHPDFPEKGIIFRDIFPVFQEPSMLETVVNELVLRVKTLEKIDVIAGINPYYNYH